MNPLNMGFQTIINYSLKFFLGFMLPMSYPMSPDVISSLVVTLQSPRHSPSPTIKLMVLAITSC